VVAPEASEMVALLPPLLLELAATISMAMMHLVEEVMVLTNTLLMQLTAQKPHRTSYSVGTLNRGGNAGACLCKPWPIICCQGQMLQGPEQEPKLGYYVGFN
jgi:hypothetical protein